MTIKIGQSVRKRLSAVMAVLLMVSALLAGREAAYTSGRASAEEEPAERYCVVIDAGHGGNDPGKVGCNGILEKDVNLEIAKLLAMFLEAEGVEVILTREGDAGLYDPGTDNKKVQDMKRRIAIIEEAEPDLTVSIHQNSYPEESVHGAQVFYYEGSSRSQALAQQIQSRLTLQVDPDNRRGIKANDSYYLLKKTKGVINIVECGFLSNPEEAELLGDRTYQERTAWAIHTGIMRYLNSMREP